MRVVDMRRPPPTKRRWFGLLPPKNTRPFVLSYEAVNQDGERVRYLRNLSWQGIEMLGVKLAQFSPRDQRVGSVKVTRPDLAQAGDPPSGPDVTHWFECFTQPVVQASPIQLRANLRMLTYEPGNLRPDTRTATQVYLDGGGDPSNGRTMAILAEADRSRSDAVIDPWRWYHERGR